jgi:hypothetical protein
MGDGRAFRQKRICKPSAFESVIAIKCGVELILALALLTDYYPGLVVADFNDIRFGHGSCSAGFLASIL